MNCPYDVGGIFFRRDPLVRSDEHRSIIHSFSAGTTSVPLRSLSSEGPACQGRFSEGRACHVRRLTFDRPFPSGGDSSPAPKAGLKPGTPYVEPGPTSVPLRPFRRDLLVGSDLSGLMNTGLAKFQPKTGNESSRRRVASHSILGSMARGVSGHELRFGIPA